MSPLNSPSVAQLAQQTTSRNTAVRGTPDLRCSSLQPPCRVRTQGRYTARKMKSRSGGETHMMKRTSIAAAVLLSCIVAAPLSAGQSTTDQRQDARTDLS